MEAFAQLPQQLHRASSAEERRTYCNQVVAAGDALLEAGVRVSEIEHAVTCAHDRLLVYLLHDAEALLGAPPCPYAWIVLGSQGRYEQTLHTDQDNALVYTDDAPPEAEPYFTMLAEWIVKQLVECGFPRCPGEILATNPQWRQPLRIWRRYFRHWIKVPKEEALLRAAIFFDYRQVHGTLDADRALRPVIDHARTQRLFLGLLARAALRHPPPLGFFQQFITEHSGSAHDLIDLKLRGTAPIVDLARLFALEAGCAATNTLARLRMSTTGSSLNKADAEELAAAFDQISLLRLRYHYERIRHGEQPTNLVPVSWLSQVERRELKQALCVLRDVQRGVAAAFQAASFS